MKHGAEAPMEADLVSLRGIAHNAQALKDDWWIDTRLQPYDLVIDQVQPNDLLQSTGKKDFFVASNVLCIRHETRR